MAIPRSFLAGINLSGVLQLSSSAGTSGQVLISQGTGNTPVWTSSPNLLNPLLTRVDSTSEGGQLNFARSSDGAQYWYIDTFGSTATPDLRVIEGSSERFRFVAGGALSVGGSTGSLNQVLTSAGGSSSPTWTTPISATTQSANLFYAGPTSGSATPTFRGITSADIYPGNPPTIYGQAITYAPVGNGMAWTGPYIPNINGTFANGTATSYPVKFGAGTNLTTPVTGAVEFDGNAFFATPKVNNTTAGRGLIPTQQYFVPNANTTIVTVSGSTGTFSGNAMGGKAIYLAASTTYEVEAVLYVQHTWTGTATSNLTINLTYPTGSTAMVNAMWSPAASLTTSAAVNQFVMNSTTAVVLQASPATGTWYRMELKGIIKTSTTAGNFSPTFGFTTSSGATTATNTIGANSFIKVNPIAGVGADINIGGWA